MSSEATVESRMVRETDMLRYNDFTPTLPGKVVVMCGMSRCGFNVGHMKTQRYKHLGEVRPRLSKAPVSLDPSWDEWNVLEIVDPVPDFVFDLDKGLDEIRECHPDIVLEVLEEESNTQKRSLGKFTAALAAIVGM